MDNAGFDVLLHPEGDQVYIPCKVVFSGWQSIRYAECEQLFQTPPSPSPTAINASPLSDAIFIFLKRFIYLFRCYLFHAVTLGRRYGRDVEISKMELKSPHPRP